MAESQEVEMIRVCTFVQTLVTQNYVRFTK